MTSDFTKGRKTVRGYLAAVVAGMCTTFVLLGIIERQGMSSAPAFSEAKISEVLGGVLGAGMIGFIFYSPLALWCVIMSAFQKQMTLWISCLVGALGPTLLFSALGWLLAKADADYSIEVAKYLVAIAVGGCVAGAVFWRIGLKPTVSFGDQ